MKSPIDSLIDHLLSISNQKTIDNITLPGYCNGNKGTIDFFHRLLEKSLVHPQKEELLQKINDSFWFQTAREVELKTPNHAEPSLSEIIEQELGTGLK